jgi:hypothetical protein
VWLAYKHRPIDQWKRIESPEIKTCVYNYSSLTRLPRIHLGGRVSLINGFGKTRYPYAKE